MIISHRHRFLFVQVPQTGSTAVGRYLQDHTDCESVLRKHATLQDARHEFGDVIRDYTLIASVRHPVDQVVSSFYKLRTDHAGELRRSGHAPPARSSRERRLYWAADPANDLDRYVQRFMRFPFAPVWLPSMRAADHMMRFESLAADVERFRPILGCDGAPPLPVANVTERPREGTDEMLSDSSKQRLMTLLGPFMREWNYDVPHGWPHGRLHATVRAAYAVIPPLKLARRSIARRHR